MTMTPQQLRRKIQKLDAEHPITRSLEEAFADRRTRKIDPWYGSQKEHWLRWLKEYDGPGHYGRENWEVDAKTVYNRVVNPSMVLWLGEACGLRREQVQTAAEAALGAGDTMATQSAAIRRLNGWAEIEARLSR